MTVREKELADLSPGTDPARGRLAAFLHRLIGPFRRGSVPPPRPSTGFYTDTTVCIGCKACEVACKQWNQLPADGFHFTGNSYDNTGELSATSWRHVKFIEQFPPGVGDQESGIRSQGSGVRNQESGIRSQESGVRSQESGVRDQESGIRSQESGGGEDSISRLSLPVVPSPAPLTPDPWLLTPDAGRWLMMSDVCKHCVAAPCQQACPTGALLHNEFDNVYIQPDICNGCAYCIATCPFGVITRSAFDGRAHKCTLCYDRQRDGLVPACAKACPTQSIQFGPVEELRDRARRRVEELHQRGVSTAYLYGDQPSETYSALNSFYLLVDRPSIYGLPEHPFNPWLNMKGDYLRAMGSGVAALVVLLVVFWVMGH